MGYLLGGNEQRERALRGTWPWQKILEREATSPQEPGPGLSSSHCVCRPHTLSSLPPGAMGLGARASPKTQGPNPDYFNH